MAARPFPPSPRRRALARRAGLVAASPWLVGGAALAIAVALLPILARIAAEELEWRLGYVIHTRALEPADLVEDLRSIGAVILRVALPLVGLAAAAAIVAHVAQLRGVWLPRRRVPGAPVVAPARFARGAGSLGAAIVVGLVAFGWLWAMAPRLAALFDMRGDRLPLVGALLASALAAFAIAVIALGVIDALARHAALGAQLAMTSAEKREDDRLAAADPRWREVRASLARGANPAEAVAASTLVLVDGDAAAAIAWDPVRRPIPTRLAVGRGARAAQLLALARRYRVAIHTDALASSLAADDGPIPEAHWPRLAEIVAALRPRE
ncbi:MAG TPA: EscU/YscU/HrcU family type III secretion system export apparatus switch protein [Kofleriaceae bacterium]|jgi:flagellar biosynthesis protein FlhB